MVGLSPLDTSRFGIVSARAKLVTAEALPEIEAFCADNKVKFLIARCSTTDISAVHAMEARAYNLMDTLVYLRKDLGDGTPEPTPNLIHIEKLNSDDIPQVLTVASKSFSNHKGHYHMDPRLDPIRATEVYTSWAEKCCTDQKVANQVFVAKVDGRIVGFRALRMNNAHQAEFVLAGVLPENRKQGIYGAFVAEGLRWAKAKGADHVINSTLLINAAVLSVCIKAGFYPTESYHTFHKWYD